MGSIGRYIFRTMSGAFLVVLVSITTLMWITQSVTAFMERMAAARTPRLAGQPR